MCSETCVGGGASCTTISNYVCKALSYSSSTGRFTGTITTNGCPNYTPVGSPTGTCTTATIPSVSAGSDGKPVALAFGGEVAYLLNGQLMYGSVEQGISCTDVTTGKTGTCAKGTDVWTCLQELRFYCPNNYAAATIANDYPGFVDSMADQCGFHASPYHLHYSPQCSTPNYAATKSSKGHSPLVAVSKDGYGIYGLYETADKEPTDLDACNGHWGTVNTDEPYTDAASGISGFAGSTATYVYHYHTSSKYPYTIGCYKADATTGLTGTTYPTVSYDTCTTLVNGLYDNAAFCKSYIPIHAASGTIAWFDDYCQCKPTSAGGPQASIVYSNTSYTSETNTAHLTAAQLPADAKCWPGFGGWTTALAGGAYMYPITTTVGGYKSEYCSESAYAVAAYGSVGTSWSWVPTAAPTRTPTTAAPTRTPTTAAPTRTPTTAAPTRAPTSKTVEEETLLAVLQ